MMYNEDYWNAVWAHFDMDTATKNVFECINNDEFNGKRNFLLV